MQAITSTGAFAPRPDLVKADTFGGPKGDLPPANNFEAALNGDILATDNARGCDGIANTVDMEAFFAAWGTDNAEFDADGSGIVDGADLAYFLGNDAGPEPGSIADVQAQWGVRGESTADLSGDGVVDGEDLALALSAQVTVSENAEDGHMTKLETLLSEWGSDAARSDLNGDGIVDGADLSIMLAGGNSTSTSESHDAGVPNAGTSIKGAMAAPLTQSQHLSASSFLSGNMQALAGAISGKLESMGFTSHPPQNLGELVGAFKLSPGNSKLLMENLVDLFGGKTGQTITKA